MRIYSNYLLYFVVLWTTISQFVATMPSYNLTMKDTDNITIVLNTDCCSRRSSTTFKPPPPVKPTIPTTPSIPENYRLPCTESESYQTACLNGGSCTALQLGNTRALNCYCLPDFTGIRCEEKKINLFFITDRMKTANVAAGVAIAIVICVAILIGVYIYIRWRRKRRVAEERQQREGPIVVPFRNSQKYNDICKEVFEELLPHKEQQKNSENNKDGQLVNSSMCIMSDTDGHSMQGDVNRNNGMLYHHSDQNHGDDTSQHHDVDNHNQGMNHSNSNHGDNYVGESGVESRSSRSLHSCTTV